MSWRPTKPRIGLSSSALINLDSALITPGAASFVSGGTFSFAGFLSPSVPDTVFQMDGQLFLRNYSGVSVTFSGSADSIHDHTRLSWFMEEVDGGSTPCVGGLETGSVVEFSTSLTGKTVVIPQSIHNLTHSPRVRVYKSSGEEVSTVVTVSMGQVTIDSNIDLTNHTAILR